MLALSAAPYFEKESALNPIVYRRQILCGVKYGGGVKFPHVHLLLMQQCSKCKYGSGVCDNVMGLQMRQDAVQLTLSLTRVVLPNSPKETAKHCGMKTSVRVLHGPAWGLLVARIPSC